MSDKSVLIDGDFAALLPAPTAEAQAALEDSVVRHGREHTGRESRDGDKERDPFR